MNESFVFYKSFADAIAELPAEQYKAVMIALTTYALNGEEPEVNDPFVKALLTLMKPQIDANNRRRDAGQKGGKQSQANGKQSEASTEQSEANAKQSEASDKQTQANTEQSEASGKQSEASDEQTQANVNVNVNVNANANTSCAREVKPAVQEKLDEYFEYLEDLDQKPVTVKARNVIVQKLVSITDIEVKQLQLIDEAMKNGWHNVYERGEPSAGKAKDGQQGEAQDLDAWLNAQVKAVL